MDSKEYQTVSYHDYLGLGKILDAQNLRSEELGKPAHDEMLFIVIHQVYELWFKQIAHELKSVMEMLGKTVFDDKEVAIAVSRLNRITEIQKIMIDQIRVLETMTPLDFLDFRNYLVPASGFQSFQFRVVEIMLGLRREKRLTYNQSVYASVFPVDKQQMLEDLESKPTLYSMLTAWLERTPFLDIEGFDFERIYLEATKKMTDRELENIANAIGVEDTGKEMRHRMVEQSYLYIKNSLDPENHQKEKDNGNIGLSYRALLAALMINAYRDEPILRGPFNLLSKIIDLDELFTTWRYRHSQMVMRMLGKKMGTGGSSGHDYLKKTAERHHIYKDFHNISSLLIPRGELPDLPEHVSDQLGFVYTKRQ
jgi:tryptophan 2,3-dioxygenase